MEQSDVLSGASRLGCDPIKAASMFNQCWECKCWVEVTFFFRTEQWAKHHSTDVPQRMFLHLSIDQWKADLMALTPEGNFITHRMLPPGRTWFFFSEGTCIHARAHAWLHHSCQVFTQFLTIMTVAHVITWCYR
jgi:hypothetical protein